MRATDLFDSKGDTLGTSREPEALLGVYFHFQMRL